ncbi:MAG: hypothetical protein V4663_16285 [Bacteroidota bacterium]
MKRETLVVLVRLVLDTNFESTEQTALEIRGKLKMKMMDSKDVNLLEANLIGCVAPDALGDSPSGGGVVN